MWTILCMVMAAGSLANRPQEFRKPNCTTAIHGRFWPEAANSDSRAARRLAQCGALEMCSGKWRLKWKPVAVNIRQLGKDPQEPTAACVAVMAEYGEASR